MKIRNGFVSNSSSTSFTFCFKGEGIGPLTDLILTKYCEQFSRSYDEWHCNAMDVVEAIEFRSKPDSDFHKVSCDSIDKVIADEQANLEYANEDVENAKKDKKSCLSMDYEIEIKQTLEAKIQKLESTKKKGLTTVLRIGFGDNHGEVQGGNLGYAMDYDGRYIDINEDDLVVFTEQNR